MIGPLFSLIIDDFLMSHVCNVRVYLAAEFDDMIDNRLYYIRDVNDE